MKALVCRDLVKVFGSGRGGEAGRGGRSGRGPGRARPAVDGVSLEVEEGETFALVGESGCGKTTLVRMAAGLLRPTAGRVVAAGLEVWPASRRDEADLSRRVQVVFQDPGQALDPRQTVGAAVEEPLLLHRLGGPAERAATVRRLLEMVGLGPDEARRFPHQLSGGQKQRVFLARALALRPRLLLLDEPVSALDVSVRAQVLNLLSSLQRRLGLTYFLISHDLAVVRRMADRVAVMHRGRLVEEGPMEEVWSFPAHPYTRALLEALLVPDPTGRPPPPTAPPPEFEEIEAPGRGDACLYRARCPETARSCRRRRPEWRAVDRDGRHLVACHQF